MFRIEKNGIEGCCLEMERIYGQMEAYREQIAELERKNPESAAVIQRQLSQLQEKLLQEERLMYQLAAALWQVLAAYQESENRVIAILEEESFSVFTEELRMNRFQWLEDTGIRFE